MSMKLCCNRVANRESIRKKHRALKSRIEEDIALNGHFKSLIEPLRLFVDSSGVRVANRESRDENAATTSKREKKETEEHEEGEDASETFEHSMTLHKYNDQSHDRAQPITFTPRVKIVLKIESLENVFETTEDSLTTKIQNQLQILEGRKELRTGLGSLGQNYVEAVLSGAQDKESGIDHVYGVYIHKDGLISSNKRFFKHVIAPLMSITHKKQKKKFGTGLCLTMTLNDNI